MSILYGSRSLAIIIVTFCLSACEDNTATKVASPVTTADMIIRGGPVITVDASLGVQEAVALQGHQIIAVGSEADIERYLGEATEVVELNGRPLIPGFIEGHGHFRALGRTQRMLDLTQASSFADIVEQVAIAADSAKPGEWIFGSGWHQEKWQTLEGQLVEGVPTNTTLNAISNNNPVYLTHASGHAAFANHAALTAAGIDQDSIDPEGGTIVRSASGSPTGLLRENAQDLVERSIGIYQSRLTKDEREEQFRQDMRLASQIALEHGITSFHDAGAPFAQIDAMRKLEVEQKLPVRLYVMVRGESNADMDAKLKDYLMPLEGNDFLTVRSIKRQIDGALGAHGAWLLEPYEDLPETSGLMLEPLAEIEETARLALEYGYQVNTHAIGTRANRETLDLYERIWQATQTDGQASRWRIEHAQHIHPQDIPRFAELGVIAAIQGVHCTSDGPWIPSRLGELRTETTSYRWRDLLDSGARINNGTDVPVEHINPIASYYASVSRMTNTGEKFHPTQGMTRMEALKSYTLDNAYSAFEEDHKGSITPGKYADLVVLSQDILQVPEDDIADTTVDMTIVGGEVRYIR